MRGENPTAGVGDSGGAVVGQMRDHSGFDFVGLLVSVLEFETVLGRDITLGLMIPAQKVFEYLKPEPVSSGLC
jgi:hypothetical protein